MSDHEGHVQLMLTKLNRYITQNFPLLTSQIHENLSSYQHFARLAPSRSLIVHGKRGALEKSRSE